MPTYLQECSRQRSNSSKSVKSSHPCFWLLWDDAGSGASSKLALDQLDTLCDKVPKSVRYARGKREERANSTMTAVNILEKQQNLLQANGLRQLLMYSDCDFMSLNIVLCIVNAKLLVKLGDMDKDRVALNHTDNPPSMCRHTSKNAHDSDPTAPKVSSRHNPVSRSFGTMPVSGASSQTGPRPT